MKLLGLCERIVSRLPITRRTLSGVNSAGPQWDSNKFNGRARRRGWRGPKALARRAGGRPGGGGTTRSTGLHGWRSENAFYSPPLPPLRGDAKCRWGQRRTIVYTRARVCADACSRARRMEAAKGKTRGFKKWTVILACGLYRILEPKHLPRYTCARVRVRTHTHV